MSEMFKICLVHFNTITRAEYSDILWALYEIHPNMNSDFSILHTAAVLNHSILWKFCLTGFLFNIKGNIW